MAEEFNMYTTEKKKVVREMVVFLHYQYIVFAVDLTGGQEYDYWEHIEVHMYTYSIPYNVYCIYAPDFAIANLLFFLNFNVMYSTVCVLSCTSYAAVVCMGNTILQ